MNLNSQIQVGRCRRIIEFLANVALVEGIVDRPFHLAAAVVVGSKIISYEVNDGLAHAEVRACRCIKKERFHKAFSRDTSNERYNIVVVRVLSNGSLGHSRPCSNCVRDLGNYNIKGVFYINQEGEVVYELIHSMTDTYVSTGYRLVGV